ncbi:class I SAM-dependent methyltransferase [Bacillus niameyensis]|uniref:class I SAM-dependent methyltransferase n=1 Tax=Bacillus niameyensis TaxID=1522308 RepID=UPI0007823AD4|nr:class I SAM-dependent methyltransferase [Bacillus niameyensis]
MKKPLDRVTEAYYGDMGIEFANEVRNRIHWICAHAEGESILDVGCSQGIASIILGREGKHVLGIDLLDEAIEFANQSLDREDKSTKNNVKFEVANFMNYDFGNQQFDSIIIGEVLANITDPKRFLNKAKTLLVEGGSIIVTVPFGVNDYFGHKKIYYLSDLLELQKESLVIDELEFIEKSVGVVFKNNVESAPLLLDEHLTEKLEFMFYTKERKLITDIQTKHKVIENSEENVQSLKKEINKDDSENNEYRKNYSELEDFKNTVLAKEEQIIQQNKNLIQENMEIKQLLNERLNKIQSFYTSKENQSNFEPQNEQTIKPEQNMTQSELADLINVGNMAKISKKEKVQVQSELLQAYEKEEKLLNKIIDLQNELESLKNNTNNTLEENKTLKANLNKYQGEKETLKAKNEELLNHIKLIESQIIVDKKEKINVQGHLFEAYEKEERLLKSYQKLLNKYNALSNSKLGKVTLAYWRKRAGKKTVRKG